MFLYGIFRAGTMVNGSKFNNRAPEDDPGYQRYMRMKRDIDNMRTVARGKGHKPQANSKFAAEAKRRVYGFLTVMVICAIALYFLAGHISW